MATPNSNRLFSRVTRFALLLEFILFVTLLLFTKSLLYGIISLAAAVFTISGFQLMIKGFDKFIHRQKGMPLALYALFKLLLIFLAFYLLSRFSVMAVISFTLGLSMIVGGIMVEAFTQVYRELFNGRT